MADVLTIKQGQKVKPLLLTKQFQDYCKARSIVLLLGSFEEQSNQLNQYANSLTDGQYILGLWLDYGFQFEKKGGAIKNGSSKGYILLSQKFFVDANEVPRECSVNETFIDKYNTRFLDWSQTLVWILQEMNQLGCNGGLKFTIDSAEGSFKIDKFDDDIDFVMMNISVTIEN